MKFVKISYPISDAMVNCLDEKVPCLKVLKTKAFGNLLSFVMYRRDPDRGRRSAKRSRSPDERERSPRDDKRRRSYANERRPERSRSPRDGSSTVQNGRDERYQRREERKERDSRSRPQGKFPSLISDKYRRIKKA